MPYTEAVTMTVAPVDACPLFQLPDDLRDRLMSYAREHNTLTALARTSRSGRILARRYAANAIDLSGRRDAIDVLKRVPAADADRIRHIKLQFCTFAVGDGASLESALAPFSALSSVNLDGCSDMAAESLRFLGSDRLRRLSLYWVPRLTDDVFIEIASRSPALTDLNLSGAKLLTNAAIVAIAPMLRRLVRLDLTKAVRLTDPALIAIAKNCRRLTYLNLYSCPSFTDVGVQEIARRCKRLRYVDLCGGQFLRDATIEALAVHCPDLEHLNLTWCVMLTDASLAALGKHARRLRSLVLLGIASISDAGIKALAVGAPELRTLDVNGCMGVQLYADEEQVRKLFPRLQSLAAL